MKKTLMALAALTLLVAGISFGVARWSVRRADGKMVMNLNDAAWLRHELGLTDAQSAEVDKLEKEFNARMQDSCDKHCGARFALGDELAKSTLDVIKARACVDRMVAAQADSERATLDHILAVRALLTPEQQQRYAKLVSQQVCYACPIKPGSHVQVTLALVKENYYADQRTLGKTE
jgi:Spy/CpxP family protein refolding chaperone